MARKKQHRTGSQHATLAKVAELSGVSEITVSRVLRNKGAIAEQTRKRVLSAVDKIGYVPNRLAGSLASAGSNLVGVIVPSLSNIVFPEVLRGVHAALEATDTQAVMGLTDYDIDIEERLVRSLIAWQLKAMLIVGLDHTVTTSKLLRGAGIRIAELMDIDSEPIDIAVGMSNRTAGLDSGRYLLKRGYRRFGYVGHDWVKDRRARHRFDGLVAALREQGISLVDREVYDGPSSPMSGRAGLANLLARAPDIDVVAFSNDDMAVGGVFHCISENIKLKQDLAIFGFNGLGIGMALPYPLSTVRSHRFSIGKTAVEMVLKPRESGSAPIVVDMGYEIIEGATA